MILLYKLINYTGIAALCFFMLTFYIGVTEGSFVLHKWFAIMGMSFAFLHAGLIGYRFCKLRCKKSPQKVEIK